MYAEKLKWTIKLDWNCSVPAFVFPAEAGTRLQTPDGWKAELALSG